MLLTLLFLLMVALMNSTGDRANRSSFKPSISAGGRWIAFDSLADNLAAEDSICIVSYRGRFGRSHSLEEIAIETLVEIALREYIQRLKQMKILLRNRC